MMGIMIENLVEGFNSEKPEQLIQECLGLLLKRENMDMPCEINVLLVDNREIRAINRQYRKVDRETDVLSFPMVEMVDGKIISTDGDFDMDENSLLLGDIVISVEKARKQAEEYGHSTEREFCFLATHGLLHLLGYDHENPEQEKLMRSRQEGVLKDLGLGR